MGKLSLDLSSGTMHPIEALFATGTLGALNAEIIVKCDGRSVVSVDLRGTFSMTVEVSGSVDNVNWTPIPMKPLNMASKLYVAAITGAVQGVWVGACAGFRLIRVRVTAYTSGAATAYLVANGGALDQSLDGLIASGLGTVTAAIGIAATMTLASPGAGLRHYLTYLTINRFAGAALTPAATPVLVTTTNLLGAVFSLPADAAVQGTIYSLREDFAYPLAGSALATATTIVAPATTGVIWRITAGFYVAP